MIPWPSTALYLFNCPLREYFTHQTPGSLVRCTQVQLTFAGVLTAKLVTLQHFNETRYNMCSLWTAADHVVGTGRLPYSNVFPEYATGTLGSCR